ncbi:MAG: BatD family protein [Bacteroidales bacterium]|jgi:hypothetical protein|nr:BatD family protein [Bacteroidales bacterium]
MRNKKLFLKYGFIGFITGIISVQILHAQVSCTAKAPSQVAAGQAFHLTYELNERADKLPSIAFANFTFGGGPSTQSSTSTSIINGQVNTKQSFSYTYTLIAEKEGTFTLPAVAFQVKNQKIMSNAVNIRVVAASQNQQQNQGNQRQAQQTANIQGFNKNDFFIKTSVSNANPYVGEQVIVSYKLYLGPQAYRYRYQVTSRPTAQGFWTYDLTNPDTEPAQKEEIIDGKKFMVTDIYTMAVYPQKSGKLTITPMESDLLVQVLVEQRRSNDIFDMFFGGSRIENVDLKISSNAVNMQVKDVPAANKPHDFSGLTGDFKLNAKLSRDKLNANDATNLSVTISGSGNLQYIEPLDLHFPIDIAVHDPETKDNIHTSLSGVTGSRTFEYVLIPRVEGDYVIPPANFVYFDKRKGSYVTLQTPEFTLNVDKAQGGNAVSYNTSNKSDIKVLGNDIRHIKTNPKLQLQQTPFFASPLYWCLLFFPVLLLAVLIILLRKKIKEQQNLALLRNKKASKTARNRLKKAEKLLKSKQDEAFYIEISKVLWGYISDKFHIPMSQLSLETAYQKLSERDMNEDSINEFVHTLQDCEYVRFSPSPSITPEKMYERTFNFITKIERELKTKRRPAAITTFSK